MAQGSPIQATRPGSDRYGSKADAVAAVPKPPARQEQPCQATANTVLGLLQSILEERAQAQDGRLSMEEIRQVIGQFMDAPGQLKSFYGENYESCMAAAGPALVGASQKADFEARVTALGGQEDGSLTLGHIQMVGLEKVRARLGDRWETAVERVHAAAEGIMRRRLAPADTFMYNQDGDILICFAELSDEDAWFKAKLIGREISEHLLGCEEASAFDGLDMDFETLTEAAELHADSHDLEMPLAGLEEGVEVGALMLQRLRKARRAMRERAWEYLEQLERRWRLVPRPITVSSGAPARFAIADVDRETGAILERLLPMVGDEAEMLVNVDLLALAAAAGFLGEESELEGALLAVTVHAATALDGAAFNRYAAACAKLPAEIRGRLILVLDDLPGDLGASALGEALRRLSGFCRLHALKLKAPRLDSRHLIAARVPLVLVDYAPASALAKRESPQFRRFLADLRDVGARLLVDRVPEPDLAEPLIEAGVELWSLDPETPAET